MLAHHPREELGDTFVAPLAHRTLRVVHLELDGASVMPFFAILEEPPAEPFMLSRAYRAALVPL
jgi:hypothetical protein